MRLVSLAPISHFLSFGYLFYSSPPCTRCNITYLQLSGKFDIFLSHDWPEGIYEYGDKYLLLRLKPFFAEDVSWTSSHCILLELLCA